MLADVQPDLILAIRQSKGKYLGIMGDLLDIDQLGLEALHAFLSSFQQRNRKEEQNSEEGYECDDELDLEVLEAGDETAVLLHLNPEA